MNITQAEELLQKNNIPYETAEFSSESEYWSYRGAKLDVGLEPSDAESRKVIALILHSKNGEKNIELQFNQTDGVFLFQELYFGDFCFERFACPEEDLADILLADILDIMNGEFAFILAYNLKKNEWNCHYCFVLSDDDDLLGKPCYEKLLKSIYAPKTWFDKLMKTKTQYEIYTWDMYQKIIK